MIRIKNIRLDERSVVAYMHQSPQSSTVEIWILAHEQPMLVRFDTPETALNFIGLMDEMFLNKGE